MKLFALLLIMLFTTSCGYIGRVTTHWTGSFTYKCSKHGVEYVQSDSGTAVSYHQDGTVVKCE